ncbi:MAG: tetratricopeptide repeat protein [Vicinamibacterales bacterium]
MQHVVGEPLHQQPDEPARALTVDEAIEIAIQLQQQGKFDSAEILYREIRRVDPENARAMHFAGVLAHQCGRSSEGVTLLQESLALSPERADWHNNLAIVLQESGRLDEAIEAYRCAIRLHPRHPDALGNLGVVLRAAGREVEAEAAYRRAIEIHPSHADAYTNLGILLNGLKRAEEAVACFCRAITLRPKHREARKLLALAHCTLGETDAAIRIFTAWLAEEPDDPIARHMLAACTGQGTPPRASNGFVETTFDHFAVSFESKLAALSYRAPRLVTALIEDTAGQPARQFDVLDAGCGTGLCGPLIAPYARTLTGVDLSAGMLAQARDKRVYDDVVQMELTEYLRRRPAAFDVIVSADTLVYFGDLAEAIAAAAAALRRGGLLVFTLERAVTESIADFHLEMHGRYTHAQGYVERLLTLNGLAPEIAHADLRMESGAPVPGLAVLGIKGRNAP